MKGSTKIGIDNYVKHRLPPGGFLYAVLANDLKGAFRKADYENLRDLGEIVYYCYNNIPEVCWGSREKVQKWIENKKED